jgi:hypothetical protein
MSGGDAPGVFEPAEAVLDVGPPIVGLLVVAEKLLLLRFGERPPYRDERSN